MDEYFVRLILVTVVLLLFLVSLNVITRHGNTLTIPNVYGKSFVEATKILESQGFDVELQDSLYNDTAAALSVLRQFPEADEVVKRNRTVYLTINRSCATDNRNADAGRIKFPKCGYCFKAIPVEKGRYQLPFRHGKKFGTRTAL
jgi:hypothetical protein